MSPDEDVPTAPVVLAIQNDVTDPPLLVGEWLAESGIAIAVIAAHDGAPVPRSVPDDVSAILALGGSVGALDDDEAPWLADERALLADAHDRGIPILGLCLGAQLLAASTGGRVDRAPVTEIGLVDVRRSVDGVVDPVIGAAQAGPGDALPTTQWHQDHVAELPADAVLLASSADCIVQAYRLGDVAYGLQFHAEVDAEMFDRWAVVGDSALARSGVDAHERAEVVRAAQVDLRRTWRPAIRAWADLVWERSRSAVASRA